MRTMRFVIKCELKDLKAEITKAWYKYNMGGK